MCNSNNVIDFSDHQPRMTAQQLIIEVEYKSNATQPPLEGVLSEMKFWLPEAMELILSEFDYRNKIDTNTGYALRVLAVLSDYFINYENGV